MQKFLHRIISIIFIFGLTSLYSQENKNIPFTKKDDTHFSHQKKFQKRYSNNKEKPLYIVNGKEITVIQLKKIDPKKIKTINVLKGEKAIKKYGKKGVFGVVEINLKKNEKTRF